MPKGPEAFRTISEVAETLDLPQHVLRFWETRFKQIKPMKRGGGRRYYRPDDVALLRGIQRLLYGEGYTIRGVQRILKEHGNQYVTAIGLGEIEMAPAAQAEPEPPPSNGVASPEETPPVARPVAREAAAAPAVPVAKPASLSAQDISQLKSVLAELENLDRVLKDAR